MISTLLNTINKLSRQLSMSISNYSILLAGVAVTLILVVSVLWPIDAKDAACILVVLVLYATITVLQLRTVGRRELDRDGTERALERLKFNFSKAIGAEWERSTRELRAAETRLDRRLNEARDAIEESIEEQRQRVIEAVEAKRAQAFEVAKAQVAAVVEEVSAQRASVSRELESVKSGILKTVMGRFEEERNRGIRESESERARITKQWNTHLEEEKNRIDRVSAAESSRAAKLVEWERSDRILAFVRRDASGELPRRWVLLITVPRCGSTWLMDALRCHPAVFVEPSAAIFQALGLSANRYPQGLSNGPDACFDLEISPGKGGQIPEFDLPGLADSMTAVIQSESYAIEKLHPAFYDFQAELLHRKIEALERQEAMTVKIVYQVRDPRSTINSYIAYQRRDPKWHAHHDRADPFRYLEKSYKALQELADHRPGMIIDYGDLTDNFTQTLVSIYRYLWPEHHMAWLSSVATASQAMTDRKKRRQGFKSKFLGETVGQISGSEAQNAPLFRAHRDEIEACRVSYDALMELHNSRGDGVRTSTGEVQLSSITAAIPGPSPIQPGE